MTMYFEMYLEERGADRGAARVTHDLTGSMMKELYAGGGGSALMTDRIQALRFQSQGHHIAADFMTQGGDIPWSVYYATPQTVSSKGAAIRRFNRALEKAMHYMNEHPAADYVPKVASWYPAFSTEELIEQTEAMRRAGMWNGTRLTPASYQRWQSGIVFGGLLEQPVDPERLIASFAWESEQE